LGCSLTGRLDEAGDGQAGKVRKDRLAPQGSGRAQILRDPGPGKANSDPGSVGHRPERRAASEPGASGDRFREGGAAFDRVSSIA